MSAARKSHAPGLALILLLLAVFAAYQPGLHGPYLMDDYYNLVNNHQLVFTHLSWHALWDAAFSRQTGPLHRPFAMVSFALNYYFAGNQDAFSIKLTNVLLHLVTTLGIYLLTLRLMPRLANSGGGTMRNGGEANWGPLFVTALWALHPLQLSTVLYAVQRMAELSALFCVYAALAYVKGREALLAGRREGLAWIAGGIVVGGALATLSKENGALLPVLLLIIEAVCFRFRARASIPRWTKTAAFTVLIVPVLLLAGYLAYRLAADPSVYTNRAFTRGERLLTECRVLFFYLRLILVPDIRAMGLFHDDIVFSTGLFHPLTTAAALAGVIALAGFATWALKQDRFRPLSFAILWFLGAQLLESTIIPLELVFEHRNYLASYGPLLAFGYYLSADSLWSRVNARPLVIALLPLAIIAYLGDALHTRAREWSNPSTFALTEYHNHPNSARALFHIGYELSRRGYYRDALLWLQRARTADPRETGYALAALIQEYALGDKPSEKEIARIENDFAQNPLTDFTRQQMGYLLAMNKIATGPRYATTTQRILRALIGAMLQKNVYHTPRERFAAHRFTGLLLVQMGEGAKAVNMLDKLLAAAQDRHEEIGLELILAEVELARHHQEAASAILGKIRPAELGFEQRTYYRLLKDRLATHAGP